MTIHVHEVAVVDYKAKHILVDPDRNIAVFVNGTDFIGYAQDVLNKAGWPVDYTVGNYMCTLDKLQDKYPELFI